MRGAFRGRIEPGNDFGAIWIHSGGDCRTGWSPSRCDRQVRKGKVESVALRQTGAAFSGATPPAENSIPRNEGGSAVSVR
jgi:hypothetical protein